MEIIDKCLISKGGWFRRDGVEYHLSASGVSSLDMVKLAHAFSRHLLKPLAQHRETLRDLKGMDRRAQGGGMEELGWIAGEIYYDEVAARRMQNGAAFSCELLSEFDSFEGNHHIVHRVRESWQSEPIAGLGFFDLARFIPARVTACRFGVEVFHSRNYSSLLGFAPDVRESVSFTGDHGGAKLEIISEVPNEQGLPLQKLGIFEMVQTASRAAFGDNFNIASRIASASARGA